MLQGLGKSGSQLKAPGSPQASGLAGEGQGFTVALGLARPHAHQGAPAGGERPQHCLSLNQTSHLGLKEAFRNKLKPKLKI